MIKKTLLALAFLGAFTFATAEDANAWASIAASLPSGEPLPAQLE